MTPLAVSPIKMVRQITKNDTGSLMVDDAREGGEVEGRRDEV